MRAPRLTAVQRSYLRHLLGALLAATAAVLIAHPEFLNFLGAGGAAFVIALVPVLVKAKTPSEGFPPPQVTLSNALHLNPPPADPLPPADPAPVVDPDAQDGP